MWNKFLTISTTPYICNSCSTATTSFLIIFKDQQYFYICKKCLSQKTTTSQSIDPLFNDFLSTTSKYSSFFNPNNVFTISPNLLPSNPTFRLKRSTWDTKSNSLIDFYSTNINVSEIIKNPNFISNLYIIQIKDLIKIFNKFNINQQKPDFQIHELLSLSSTQDFIFIIFSQIQDQPNWKKTHKQLSSKSFLTFPILNGILYFFKTSFS